MTKRYIVLGCGGFIGSHLLDALLPDPGVAVVGVDLHAGKIAGHLERGNFELLTGRSSDVGIAERIREEVPRADAVINLAAICTPAQYTLQPLETIRANALDIIPLVDLCAEEGTWLLHFSTSEVYGRTLRSYMPGGAEAGYGEVIDVDEFDEETTPLVMGPVANQRWCYAAAKQLVERYIYAHGRQSGMPYTIVRPFNFFGPRMDFLQRTGGDGTPRVLACFLSALMFGRPIRLVDGGMARRSVVAIEDAIDAVLRMLERPDRARGQIFNIGHRGNEVTIRELAYLMRRIYAEETGDPAAAEHPIVETTSAAFYGEGYEDCDRRMPRLDRAGERLGWVPRRGLEETLRATIAHFTAETDGSGLAASGRAARVVER